MTAQRTVYLALGRPGCGKTRHLARRVTEHIAAAPRQLCLIHDVRMGRPGAWDADAIGCLAPEHARFETVAQLGDQADEHEHKIPSVVAIYRDDALALTELAWARADIAGQGTTIVLDELDQLPERLHRTRPDHDAAYRCLQYGRTYPIDIFASIRQPQRCDPQWFACATTVALFRLTGDLQLQRIRTSGWPAAEKLAEQVSGLLPYQYLSVNLVDG